MHQKHPSLSRRQQVLQKELYKTLAYSDVFNYPLTGKQLFQFLGVKINTKDFFSLVKTLPHRNVAQTMYYFLPKKEAVVEERIKKEKVNIFKIKQTEKIAHRLGLLPTIRFIGISGSLAMKNAEKHSDSDIFIITAPYTLWVTRLLVYLFLIFAGLKRSKKNSQNAICANMFLDLRALRFSIPKRNIYTAHEIAQLVPLVNKQKIFQKFLLANTWVKKYFPNIQFPKKIKTQESFSLWTILFPLEYIVRLMQLWHMRKKITREIVAPTAIAFHPIDYESEILTAYGKKIKKYGI